ncbi:hypothetical protein F2P81_007213 [Scophthalmus maximus]|uniref:Uncharacterized protein n=1 Tax=Scophthalmus maximus TaxID=52904 RepID=A0A6A4T819_SCOMX|nr:hypothetical protein F2P81_007213 [Scophthalmus maximus]
MHSDSSVKHKKGLLAVPDAAGCPCPVRTLQSIYVFLPRCTERRGSAILDIYMTTSIPDPLSVVHPNLTNVTEKERNMG